MFCNRYTNQNQFLFCSWATSASSLKSYYDIMYHNIIYKNKLCKDFFNYLAAISISKKKPDIPKTQDWKDPSNLGSPGHHK